MVTKIIVWLLLTAVLRTAYASGNCEKRKAFKIFAQGQKQVDFLNDLKKKSKELEVAIEKPLRNFNSSYVFTAPDCNHPKILSLLQKYEIFDYEVFNTKFEQQPMPMQRSGRLFDPDVNSKEYISYEDSIDFIDRMIEKFRKASPKISVDLKVEGETIEHRQINSITIKHKDFPENPIIFLDAGIHGREWHSRSLGLHILKQLADEAATSDQGILQKASFVIVPSVNPDGYQFSLMGDKMWRKNRKPVDDGCIGVDGNRNYDSHWNEGDREKYPCSEVYRGESAFSEIETQAVRNVMQRLRGSIKMYISIHTFGNKIIYPYGYTTNEHPQRAKLHEIAQAGANAVFDATGTVFTPDQSGSLLYVSAGGSDDYAIDEAGIPYAFTFELGNEEFGFAVKPRYLKQTLLEGWTAIRAMIMKAVQL